MTKIHENKYLTAVKEKVLELVAEVLPHGSGIDSEWHLSFSTRTRIRAEASFHCMDENGMYDGWVDFTVLFDIKNPNYFRFMYRGSPGQIAYNRRLGKKYDLESYITDSVCESLWSTFDAMDMREYVNEYC